MSYNTFPAFQGLGWPVKVTPKYKTIIQQAASGAEYRTGLWQTPLHLFEIPLNFLTQTDYTNLLAFFNGQQGALIPFWFSPIQPINYTVTNYTFATPAGSTGPFTLSSPDGNMISATVTAIYKTDWQGTNLLYPTPRTNLAAYSATLSSWAQIATVTSGAALAPDGSSTAQTIVANTIAAVHYVAANSAPIVSGQTYRLVGYVTAAGQDYATVQLDSSNGYLGGTSCFDLVNGVVTVQPSGATASISAGPNGYYLVQIDATATGASANIGVQGRPTSGSGFLSYTGDGTSGIKAWGFMLSLLSEAGDYIPTTSAAVTVTDYTLSGTQVTLGQTPAAGATLQWTGTGSISQGTQYLVRFPDDLIFEQFMYQLYKTKSIKLQEVR